MSSNVVFVTALFIPVVLEQLNSMYIASQYRDVSDVAETNKKANKYCRLWLQLYWPLRLNQTQFWDLKRYFVLHLFYQINLVLIYRKTRLVNITTRPSDDNSVLIQSFIDKVTCLPNLVQQFESMNTKLEGFTGLRDEFKGLRDDLKAYNQKLDGYITKCENNGKSIEMLLIEIK